MEIQRIDTYADSRFSECALFQHGCFLVEGRTYEIETISDFEAVVRGEEKEVYLKIIEEFRFYAPHITKFYNSRGNIIKEYSTKTFPVCRTSIVRQTGNVLINYNCDSKRPNLP